LLFVECPRHHMASSKLEVRTRQEASHTKVVAAARGPMQPVNHLASGAPRWQAMFDTLGATIKLALSRTAEPDGTLGGPTVVIRPTGARSALAE